MQTDILSLLLGRRTAVALVAVTIGVAGYLAWDALPIDAFPDVTNVQVMVLARAQGMSTTEVERQVTYPIEVAPGAPWGACPRCARCDR
ncbi:MAG: hypothetical protein FJ109_03515 [Deltaproteobacteria bacterium]|nr:hypothetical protein [Deltaproteobacteria bacterium]